METKEYDIFLSHNSIDKQFVEQIANYLVRNNIKPWLDKWNLIPGEPWQDAIEGALKKCKSCAIFIGPSGRGPWQNEEMRAAINRRVNESHSNFRVIPVLLPKTEKSILKSLPAFLSSTTCVQFAENIDDKNALHRLICGAKGIEPGYCYSTLPEFSGNEKSPYRGLLAFYEKDSPYFFGRELITKRLHDKVAKDSIVAVIGASGSGKSSLVYAGLLPILRKQGNWLIANFRPGSRPFDSVAVSIMPLLEPNLKEPELSIATYKLSEHLKDGNLYIVIEQLLRKRNNDNRLLVFVDQFEEVYTQCTNADTRKNFLNALLEIANAHSTSHSYVKIVITLRGDFYGKVVGYRLLSDALQDNIIHLPPMIRVELKSAIEKPAHKYGVTFEDGLVERILNDVGDEPGNLPLLQFSLSLIWDKQKDNILRHSAYNNIGELSGAIAYRTETLYQTLAKEQQIATRNLLSRLVRVARPEDEGNDTRKRVVIKEILNYSDILKVAYDLTNARLLVMGRDDSTSEEYVELAHEAIITSWDRLKTWLVEDREFLLWKQKTSIIYEEWRLANCDENLMLKGRLLKEAEKWIEIKTDKDIGSELFDYILGSIRLNEKEKRLNALAKIDHLLSAKPGEVKNIIKSFEGYRRWLDPKFKELLGKESLGYDEWRIRLALLPVDPSQSKPLAELILQTNPQELLIIRDALLPFKNELKEHYWSILNDKETDINRRFLAACTLALFDPLNEQWKLVSNFIAERLVNEDTLYLKEWIQALLPIGNVLLNSLREQFVKGEVETIREAAAVVLSKFAVNDPETLASLVSESTFQSYKMLFNVLTSDKKKIESGRKELKKIILKTPSGDLYESERVFLGKKRAVAAITLLHMGERESIYDVFKVEDDPEALTQFIHQVKKRNIRPELLFECLETASTSQVRYAILLALGEYEYQELSTGDRSKIKNILTDWYLSDNSSGVHGACEWLLRQYGFHDTATELNSISKPFVPNSAREWFNIQIDEKKFITFVIYPSGRFIMGSPEWEKDRSHSESPQHEVIISRPFAISNKLISRKYFEEFINSTNILNYPNISEWSRDLDCPIIGHRWFESVLYCRWLTNRIGLSESHQCYENPDMLVKDENGYPVNWPFSFDREGFRLPTEAEWEYACRSSSITAFSFGSDRNLLDYYGWSQSNAQLTVPMSGLLRPNLRGLFDMHCNCWEWCHDWHGSYPIDSISDPVGSMFGDKRILRGGCWNLDHRSARSACRNSHAPINRNYYIGLRLVFTCK